jgi:predicted glycosyltransferase
MKSNSFWPVIKPFKEVRSPPFAAVGVRVAIYSHDTMGMGHKRRNLLIAQSLVRHIPNCSVLLITGMVEANADDLPPGIDYLALPAWHKTTDGEYRPRRLDLSQQELAQLRGQIIRAALDSFNPDVFLVDNVPRGALRELDGVLEFLQKRPQTRCVLGLRDIIDDPAVVRRQWRKAGNEAAVRRYFDAIWVYGDPAVYDPVSAYRWPADIAAKVRYVGYLDGRERLTASHPMAVAFDPAKSLALCLVGGGQDGAAVTTAFAQATLPEGWQGVLVAGPLMPQTSRQWLHRQAAQSPGLTVLDYCPEPTWLLNQAAAVVAMGGYNTTCEVLAFGARALIVPRVKPRREQWIRAERLQGLGLVDMRHPDDLSPMALTQWLADKDDPTARNGARDCIDRRGLDRLPYLLSEVISARAPAPRLVAS